MCDLASNFIYGNRLGDMSVSADQSRPPLHGLIDLIGLNTVAARSLDLSVIAPEPAAL